MKKRVFSALLSVILVLGLVVPAFAITGTVTATIQDGGYAYGNSFGDASISDGYQNCRWMCMEPDGNPPQPGHSFAIEEVGGLYRTFAWMAQVELEKNSHPTYPSAAWDRLWNIHHAVSQYNGTNNHVWYPPQQAVYQEAVNYDTSQIPSDFVAFRGYPSSHGGDQICLFWGYNPPPPDGYLALRKTSADPGWTNGSESYSLAGAEYGVWRWGEWIGNDSKRAATLTTDAYGNSNTVTLDGEYYYVKEVKAPKGFQLDPTVHVAYMTPGQTTILEVSDVPMKGDVNLKKVSANPEITEGNSCYSLAGAEYAIYYHESDMNADRNRLATLTTDADGNSNTVTLPYEEWYWYKEVKAPKGFELDTSPKWFYMNQNGTTTIQESDRPTLDPAPVMCQKRTSDGTGGKPLAGAEFTFRFYGGYYDTVEAAEASGKPTRSWVFRTNENGYASYEQKFLVSGDVLYTDKAGDSSLPYGTLLIHESKAPEGYIIDPTVRLVQITDDPIHGEITLNAPIVPNTRYGRLVVAKTAINGSAEGWNFEVYDSNKQLLETITTGADGKAYSRYLDLGKYYVREVHDHSDKYWTYDVEAERVAEAVYDADTVVKYTNEQFGRMAIKKTMENTSGPLDGWQFHVTGGPDNVDLMLTSGKDGTITSDKLRPGTYTVEEILPKDSLYVCKTENPQTITVVAGETAAVHFTNALRPGEIDLTKLASDNGQALAGVTFCLEWSDGKKWQPVVYAAGTDIVKGGCNNPDVVDGCLVTGDDGRLSWGNLDPRLTYRLTELETADGYQLLPGTAWEGKLPTDTLHVALNVVNQPVFTMPTTGQMTQYGFIALAVVSAVFGLIGLNRYRRKYDE